MNKMSPEIHKADIAVPIVLQRTSHCLSHLTVHILALEQQVLDRDGDKDRRSQNPIELQTFDFLRQATEDIALMLARLADAVSPTVNVNRLDVLDAMTVQELRDAINLQGAERLNPSNFFKGKAVEIF